MNTTATFLPEPSWSRRCSTETVFSIQDRETDIVQDSSDLESELTSDDEDVEYELATETEEEAAISENTSGQSDDELKAKVVVTVDEEDRDMNLADSECSENESEDVEPAAGGAGARAQYASCAKCHVANNSGYRYCDKCFKVRKNFFPPRPRRKVKQESSSQETVKPLSQDSGFDSNFSQELPVARDALSSGVSTGSSEQQFAPEELKARLGKLKRRSESTDREYKRPRLESESDNESANREVEVAPLVKTVSDPAVTVETLDSKNDKDNLCIICYSEPKSGAFVHRRVAHICCCYNCAVKVWSKARRCPICNCKVSNVLKAVVM